jgi:hypothetical protein
MKEQDFINVEALGTIKAAIAVLKDLVPEMLPEIIKEGEAKKAIGTLYEWQHRLFSTINTEETIKFKEVIKKTMPPIPESCEVTNPGGCYMMSADFANGSDYSVTQEYDKNLKLMGKMQSDIELSISKNKKSFYPLEVMENDYGYKIVNCYTRCLTFFPEHLHPKNKKSWLDTIEKLNRIEKVPFEDIIRIVKAVREDVFWKKNFLSLTKLRKKKDGVMYIVSFNEKFKPSAKQKSASDILMERYNQNQ